MIINKIPCSIIMIAGLIALPFVPASAQEARISREVTKLAAQGLEQALIMVERAADPGLLGFDSKDELPRAQLGTPISVRTLGYDALLAHQPGARLDTLVSGPDRIVVPVTVDEETRSWINVVDSGQGWTVSGFGDTKNAQMTAKLTRPLADKRPEILHAPAFNLYAVGFTEGDQMLFVPIGPSTVPDLEPETPIPVDELLAKLANYARELDAEYGDQIRARRIVH